MSQPKSSNRTVASNLQSLRDRLDAALLNSVEELDDDDLGTLTVDTVARAADVSRATAYRHFGSQRSMILRAAELLARRWVGKALAFANHEGTLSDRISIGFAFSVRQLKHDRVTRFLLRDGGEDLDEVVRRISTEIMEAMVVRGQHEGFIRTDVDGGVLLDWLFQQLRIVLRMDLDEDAAREWAQRFVAPALNPQHVDPVGPAPGGVPAETLTPAAQLAELIGRIDELACAVRRLEQRLTR